MCDKSVPVVKPIEKGLFYVHCPFCKYSHSFSNTEKKIVEELTHGEDFTRTTQFITEEVTCRGCGEDYIIDFGKSEYTIYDPPRRKWEYERILAEFRSDWYYNFVIFLRKLHKDRDEYCCVECEFENISFLLLAPFEFDFWRDPQQVLDLAKAKWESANFPDEFH